MAFPDTLLLPASALAKVDDENYRALVIDKAQLPYPENQNGSKRLIVESMASVGINVDAEEKPTKVTTRRLHRVHVLDPVDPGRETRDPGRPSSFIGTDCGCV